MAPHAGSVREQQSRARAEGRARKQQGRQFERRWSSRRGSVSLVPCARLRADMRLRGLGWARNVRISGLWQFVAQERAGGGLLPHFVLLSVVMAAVITVVCAVWWREEARGHGRPDATRCVDEPTCGRCDEARGEASRNTTRRALDA
ncbi:unnamed protein product [Closterium sp. NIES-53]